MGLQRPCPFLLTNSGRMAGFLFAIFSTIGTGIFSIFKYNLNTKHYDGLLYIDRSDRFGKLAGKQ